jgi:hypothetical protein
MRLFIFSFAYFSTCKALIVISEIHVHATRIKSSAASKVENIEH